MRSSFILGGLFSCVATLASSQDVLVSNPIMCAMLDRGEDVQETGMILESAGMYEIEYYCEFDRQISFDWSRDITEAVVGYCSEPGFISPTVFVVQSGPYEPGIVRIWTQGVEQPTQFEICAKG